MEKKGAAKVAEKKVEEVKKLASLIQKYPTVALVDMTNLPARQLHEIRNKLKNKILIRMSKKELIRRALESTKKQLIDYLDGMPAILLSELEPFELFSLLKENQSAASAKAGQIAPKDILVNAGPTQLVPGPIVSQLGAAGIKSGIEGGKIVIKENSTVVHKGEEFSPESVDILNTFGIEPMKIGINLQAVFSGDEVLLRKVLDIDVQEYVNKLVTAHNEAWELAIKAGILVPETASFLILRAESEARQLALEANILTKENTEQLINKAQDKALKLKSRIGG